MSVVSNRITTAADKMRRGDHSHYTKSVDACVDAINAADDDGNVSFCIMRTQSLHPRAVFEMRQNFDVDTTFDKNINSYAYHCTLRKA
jgi:hypothetical protein